MRVDETNRCVNRGCVRPKITQIRAKRLSTRFSCCANIGTRNVQTAVLFRSQLLEPNILGGCTRDKL